MNYLTYLQSQEWKIRRNMALVAFDHRCAVCNSDARLEVHHRTYERLGYELPGDLVVLCADCHELYKSRMPARYSWLGFVDSRIFDECYI